MIGGSLVRPRSRRLFPAAAVLGLLAALSSSPASSKTIEVGANQAVSLPSKAAAMAMDGDTVEIAAGEYKDCAVWRANRLTIVGIGSGAVIRDVACKDKGIFVIDGNDVVVRNITFSGAKVADGNGAGIRAEGSNLTVENSRFLDNQEGILTNPAANSVIVVKDSEFIGNGTCDQGCAHGIYVTSAALLRVENSKFRQTKDGHHIKSRALKTELFGNEIMDGPSGTASYLVDIPNGGAVVMKNNRLEKGPLAGNNTAAIMIGEEHNLQPTPVLLFETNSFTNDLPTSTIFVKNMTNTPAMIDKNHFTGKVTPLSGDGKVN